MIVSFKVEIVLNAAFLGTSIGMIVVSVIWWYIVFLEAKYKEIILDEKNGVLKRVKTAIWSKNDIIKEILINNIEKFERQIVKRYHRNGMGYSTTYKILLRLKDGGKFTLLASVLQDDVDKLLKWLEIHLKTLL